MAKPPTSKPLRAWTPYEDLDLVLHHWIIRLHDVLGDNLVGAYLHGSFAVGDFDMASDVDFMVALHEDIPAKGVDVLHRLHREIYSLPPAWAQNLEGSYAPTFALRRLSTVPRDPPGEPRPDGRREPGTWRPGPFAYPFWFLSADDPPVRREYDNCQLVRWVLHEKGVRLTGPPAETIVDPVSKDDLRREMAEMLACNVDRLSRDLTWLRTVHGQASAVLVFARALETLETGEVHSKRSAVAFARARLEHWADLVAAAFEERATAMAEPHVERATDPVVIARTLAFARWAAERAARG